MSARGCVASTSVAGKGEKGCRTREGINCDHPKKPTKLIFEREFKECFHMPNDISIRLMDGGHVPTE